MGAPTLDFLFSFSFSLIKYIHKLAQIHIVCWGDEEIRVAFFDGACLGKGNASGVE